MKEEMHVFVKDFCEEFQAKGTAMMEEQRRKQANCEKLNGGEKNQYSSRMGSQITHDSFLAFPSDTYAVGSSDV